MLYAKFDFFFYQVEAMNKLKAITELLQCQALKEAKVIILLLIFSLQFI